MFLAHAGVSQDGTDQPEQFMAQMAMPVYVAITIEQICLNSV